MSPAETALIVAVWVIVAVAVAARLGPVLRRHQPAAVPPYATFTPPPPGARWLPCHTTGCGHMTTIHTPQPGGAYRCTTCGTTKGDQ
ncbi:hypothetical protein [Streptomyces sp. Isolate_219]|uniref:hypothetical protein n=1 Tax=Streptomyces sp. Isolate_219 TaxID=2950110 RepID=UPI0021CAC036|nr:hypothetical protein [Streptomyces sp. Isolate_219]MCR8574726.1 hypothetical protein [Streptomyces sp. Isolate_219]